MQSKIHHYIDILSKSFFKTASHLPKIDIVVIVVLACFGFDKTVNFLSNFGLFVCLNGPQILDPVVGRPLVGFSLKPKGLACL